MASRQSLLPLSLEHLTTAQSYRPSRQGRLITLQPIVSQLSRVAIRRSRVQRTTSLAPTGLGRITSRNRTVRRQRSRTIGPSRIVRNQVRLHRAARPQPSRTIGPSLLRGRKLLPRGSRNSALHLLRKRGLHKSSHSARSPRCRRRKRRSIRTNSRSGTRSRSPRSSHGMDACPRHSCAAQRRICFLTIWRGGK